MEGTRQLPWGADETGAEQAAKNLFVRLTDFRRRCVGPEANKRHLQSARSRLIEGMGELGFVDMVFHVEQFMREAGLPQAAHDPALRSWKLIERKYRELEDAHWAEDPEGELNAGIDMLYSVIALMLTQGHEVRGAFKEVARANEDKVAGGVKFETDGRVKKPAGWKPPELAEFVGF